MSDKYYDLFDLIEQNSEAEGYFTDLPDYIQEMIESRADDVRSFETLQTYADNLLSGDK